MRPPWLAARCSGPVVLKQGVVVKIIAWGVCLLLLIQGFARADAPATTQSALSSKPAEKDGLQVTVMFPKATFAANEQPKFTVHFKNISDKPVALYDADWFWDWNIRFEDLAAKGPWQLQLLGKIQ